MGTVHAKSVETPDSNDQNDGKPRIKLEGLRARVDKIHVDGLGRTKEDIIARSLEDLFTAEDFQQVVLKAHEARVRLESLGCFKRIGIFIDTSTGPNSTDEGLEVTFKVEELRRLMGSVNTLIGNNEGSLVLGAKLPNVLGRAEKVQLEYTHGTKRSSGFNLNFSKPLVGPNNVRLCAAVYQQNGEFPWSGYKEIDRGTFLELLFESAPRVQHSVRWEGVWRELNCLTRTTAFQVREEMGHSLKSSLKHSLSVDKRDNPILPTKGVLFRLNTEYAGLGGDTGFFKNDIELQGNMQLPFDLVFQASLAGGVLRKMYEDKMVTIADRFFLGGPLSLRGFETRGVGPHSEGCAVGGETYWCTGAHLYSPLPLLRRTVITDLFRLHFFTNAGNIGNFQFREDYSQYINTLRDNLRWAYGFGLILRVGQVARLELNYCVPVSAQNGDRPVSGLQFGVGITVL